MTARKARLEALIESIGSVESFDFFQLVSMLEAMQRDRVTVAEAEDPKREAVRFKSKIRMDFPGSDIADLEPAETAVLWVHFMGLAGHFGPLPDSFTKQVMDQTHAKSFAMRDFLDIFNHRMISLLVRNRKKHRLGLSAESPWDSRFALYLKSLLGLGLDKLQNRQAIPDRVFLEYTGMLARQTRSLSGLEGMLRTYFDEPIWGEQFCGQWVDLERELWTTIGNSGQCNRLGESAMIGTRVWDQQGGVRIHVGPLIPSKFEAFLPGEALFEKLASLVRFYLGDQWECQVVLYLQASSLPGARLSNGALGSRLGWTSWTRAGSIDVSPRVELQGLTQYTQAEPEPPAVTGSEVVL